MVTDFLNIIIKGVEFSKTTVLWLACFLTSVFLTAHIYAGGHQGKREVIHAAPSQVVLASGLSQEQKN
jgi:hypothetical protein